MLWRGRISRRALFQFDGPKGQCTKKCAGSTPRGSSPPTILAPKPRPTHDDAPKGKRQSHNANRDLPRQCPMLFIHRVAFPPDSGLEHLGRRGAEFREQVTHRRSREGGFVLRGSERCLVRDAASSGLGRAVGVCGWGEASARRAVDGFGTEEG